MAVPIEWFDEIDSTNAEARRRSDAGWAGPIWIAARRQSAWLWSHRSSGPVFFRVSGSGR